MANNQNLRYSKIANLWFQVFFYSCIITLILAMVGFNIDISVKEIMKMCMPVIFNRYWFFTAYFGLFLVRPLLDKWLFFIDENMARRALVFIVMLFSALSILSDPFQTEWGYSFVWMCIVYCVGVLLRRCHLFESRNSKLLILYLFISIAINCTVMFSTRIHRLTNYISPTILLNAVLLVILFSRLNIKGAVISKMSPLAFGIYLFHGNPVIGAEFVTGVMTFIVDLPVLTATIYVIGFALVLFFAGIVVDFIRLQLFKLLHIDRLSEKVVNVIGIMIDKLCWVVEKFF